MGGSPKLHVPSNVIVLCSAFNGAIESDPVEAHRARYNGWKLTNGQDPETSAVYDSNTGLWYWLTNDFERVQALVQ